MANVTVTVTVLAGQNVWGPGPVACSEPIGTLVGEVAKSWGLQPYEVRLSCGDVALDATATPAQAALPDGATLVAVRLDPTEVARGVLARLVSQAGPKLTIGDDATASDGPDTWLQTLAEACGCEGATFPSNVAAMLVAIRESGKLITAEPRCPVEISTSRLAGHAHGPGLLCLESPGNTEYGFRATVVDLTGAVAALFGASAERYQGAVWFHTCSDDDWTDPPLHLYSLGFGDGPSLPRWRALIDRCRDLNLLEQLPKPVAPNITSFFSQWAADGLFPAYVPRTFCIPEVDEFKATAAREHAERARQDEWAKKRRALQPMFTYLDQGKRGSLSHTDLFPLWEVLGWLAADEAVESLEAVCREQGFDTSGGISEAAFCACLPRMPLSEDAIDNYCGMPDDGEMPAGALQGWSIMLRSGPNCCGHYLGNAKRQDIQQRAVVHELFGLLDRDGDGRLSGAELRPFLQMAAGAWGGIEEMATPWGSGHATFDEAAAAEAWGAQFKELCDARAIPVETGFSEAAFAAYVSEMNVYYTELAWAADRVRTGPPPGGHHLNWLGFVYASGMIHGGGLGHAGAVAEICSYAMPLFRELYEWALQGSPRRLAVSHEGADYEACVVPARQGLPDDWRLVESAPGVYTWVLEPNT